jgi:hypothetical protein
VANVRNFPEETVLILVKPQLLFAVSFILLLSLFQRIGMILVFLMQTGFAMLEVGSVDVKNTRNILLKVTSINLDPSAHSYSFWQINSPDNRMSLMPALDP